MVNTKRMTEYNDFCISSYLTFRHVVKKNLAWKDNLVPNHLQLDNIGRFKVFDEVDVFKKLRDIVQENTSESTGILLGGGIDSAILAAFLPQGTKAYTIRFRAENVIDESKMAEVYARKCGLKHKIIDVTWDDYLRNMDVLMWNKKSPLHQIEVALFKACSVAIDEGIDTLIAGFGADGRFGGLSKLLSRDWTIDEFTERYSFVDPAIVVKRPVSMRDIYEEFNEGDNINVHRFLEVIYGNDTVYAFLNAFNSAGGSIITPYEDLSLDAPLDINKIRNGENKYILRSVFMRLYPHMDVPEKIAFARPMAQWLKDWEGPTRTEFIDDLNINQFTGEQKWLIYCLERFMNLMENER